MPDALWFSIAALGALLTTSLLPLVGWVGRRPCPHCGRRASRQVLRVQPLPGGLGALPVTYVCQACGGAMRYARQPTGQEFWEPIAGPSGEGS